VKVLLRGSGEVRLGVEGDVDWMCDDVVKVEGGCS